MTQLDPLIAALVGASLALALVLVIVQLRRRRARAQRRAETLRRASQRAASGDRRARLRVVALARHPDDWGFGDWVG